MPLINNEYITTMLAGSNGIKNYIFPNTVKPVEVSAIEGYIRYQPHKDTLPSATELLLAPNTLAPTSTLATNSIHFTTKAAVVAAGIPGEKWDDLQKLGKNPEDEMTRMLDMELDNVYKYMEYTHMLDLQTKRVALAHTGTQIVDAAAQWTTTAASGAQIKNDIIGAMAQYKTLNGDQSGMQPVLFGSYDGIYIAYSALCYFLGSEQRLDAMLSAQEGNNDVIDVNIMGVRMIGSRASYKASATATTFTSIWDYSTNTKQLFFTYVPKDSPIADGQRPCFGFTPVFPYEGSRTIDGVPWLVQDKVHDGLVQSDHYSQAVTRAGYTSIDAHCMVYIEGPGTSTYDLWAL